MLRRWTNPRPSIVPAHTSSPIAAPTTSAATTSKPVSQAPPARIGRLLHRTPTSNVISGPRGLDGALKPVGQRAEKIAEGQIHRANRSQGFDRFKGIGADPGRDRHQLAD